MSGPPVNGAEALVRALEACGVRHAFGLPGSQNVTLFEALRTSGIRTIVPTHELAAAFMAGAYYRASGRPAALVTIPGPGFAYALTGLAEARLDSAALLHITGAPPSGPGELFRLQELKQGAIAGPLVKGLVIVERPDEVTAAVHRAHALALAGEPGPVMLMLAEAAWGPLGGSGAGAAVEQPTADDVAPLLGPLRTARRVVLLAGQGAQGAAPALRAWVERLRAPVVTTSSGRGVLPEDHPLAMGFDTHRGTIAEVNQLLESADLVVVLGCKLGHNGTAGFALRLPADRTIQVDVERGVPGANYQVAASAVTTVEAFLAAASLLTPPAPAWTDRELADWKRRISTPVAGRAEPRIAGTSPAAFFRGLQAALPRDAIVVTDSGLHQILARRYLDVLSPRGLLLPSDFQAMGFGVPAAIAAALAAPDRPVVALVGDGGLAMSGLELGTAVRERLPVTVIVFNDGYLNQIRLQQLDDYGHDHGVRVAPLDFAAFAAAVGAGYELAGNDIGGAVRGARPSRGPTLIEVRVGDSPAVAARWIGALARSEVRARVPGWVLEVMKKLRRR